ncbi:hypothetical protein QFZ51_006288 [Chitinophaga sp. W3I9]
MAFKRHFIPEDSLPGLDDAGRKIMFNLQQQYQ